jgi:hypothetical protein
MELNITIRMLNEDANKICGLGPTCFIPFCLVAPRTYRSLKPETTEYQEDWHRSLDRTHLELGTVRT